MLAIVSIGLCSILLIASIFASYRAIRDPYSELRQKCFQLILIWLVPGLGAGLVLVLVSNKSLPSSGKFPIDSTVHYDLM
jgi:hypothetical protein